MSAAAIAERIRHHRFHYGDEDALQEGIALLLGEGVEREVRLNARDRIDLLLDGVGIEVKVAGAKNDVLRQLARYAQSDRIEGLVLVTSRVRHRMPYQVVGKPIEVVLLAAAGL